MASINRVVLVGRLTKDPVLRKTGSGTSVVSFTVACDRRVKTEGQPTADFINTVAWNKTADVVCQYTHKGSLVGVEGRIQTRSYDDRSGRRVFVTEVIADSIQLLESKKSQETYGHEEELAMQNEEYDQYAKEHPEDPYVQQDYSSNIDISADDLPFNNLV